MISKSLGSSLPLVTIGNRKVVDVWNALQLSQTFKYKAIKYTRYTLNKSLRWDQIAEELYGDRTLWWVLPLVNDIDDPFAIYFDDSIPGSITSINALDYNDVLTLLNEFDKKII
jgi:hypothetical protein